MPALSQPAGAAGAPRGLRRQLGAFYTPDAAVAHMLTQLTGLDAGSRVLEPSGGDGAFVRSLLDSGVRPDQIDVWDLDGAVEADLTATGVRFTRCDALLEPPVGPGPVYTHVVGNPPYLNKHSDYVRTHRGELARAYKVIGANDTYAMFTYMAFERLAPGGQLVFLVSDTFLTLGIHRRLREHLLANATINSVTLLPTSTFPDAAVRTAILDVTRTPASDAHQVTFRDLRGCAAADFTGGLTHTVPQKDLADGPASVFAFDPDQRQMLKVLAGCAPLMSVLDGGLGMFTRDNGTYLAVVSRDGHTLVRPAPGVEVVDAADVDGQVWRMYHKRGGAARWWQPAEHAVRWDPTSQAAYGVPASALAGAHTDGTPRQGVIVSGVATTLTARLATTGAMWESNKAFALFPHDPERHPVTFLLAVLNSSWYARCARALNHTVSMQVRDLKALPLLPFTGAEICQLATLGAAAVEHARAGGHGQPPQQAAIDELVECAAARVA